MKYTIILIFLVFSTYGWGQKDLPKIRTYDDVVHIYLKGKKDRFPIAGLKEHFTADLPIPAIDTVGLISEMDSITFIVGPSDTINFNVVRLNTGDTIHCRFNFKEEIQYASFTNEYKREHDGRRIVEVPKVYELVNIIFSLTEASLNDKGIVRKDTDYFDLVKSHFNKYSKHPIVEQIDSLLTNEMYLNVKMDAYAFEFDRDGKIVESPIYHILSWEDSNSLLPHLDLLNDFAARSNFLGFYGKRQDYYSAQYSTFSDTLRIDGMIEWLKRNFPLTEYNSYKIVYSPLVGGNQSSWWWEDNNFRELQAHVNFPYLSPYYFKLKPEIRDVVRGDILFTELNHGFVNPETTRNSYGLVFRDIFEDMGIWIDMKKPSNNYQNPFACFNEYLNWGLVSLRYYDNVPEGELKKLQGEIEKMMVEHRGFIKFARFNQFLLEIYKNRAKNQTIADLYPLIVSWFQINKG